MGFVPKIKASEGIDNITLLVVIGCMYLVRVRVQIQESDELREAKAAAEYASQSKSVFMSNMSHEIRTPINAVLGMNEMILRESEEPNIIEYSENIRTAGNTLLGLINDILDFSKIEAGKMDIIPVNYDLSSLINDLVTMIQARTDKKGLLLKLDFDENIPKMLDGDEVRIKQAEDMTKLFSEFERIEEKRNRNIEGTGLGMNISAIMRQLIKRRFYQ